MKPSPRRAIFKQKVTIALIMDCPTITVHAGKHYKALIDSGAAISLVRYSVCENTDHHLKTAIQSTSIHLNTVDGSPMTALGITTLQLWIADFKFLHTFIICVRFPDTEILFALMYRRNLHYPMLGTEKGTATFRRKVESSPTPETVNRRQMLLFWNQPLWYHPDTKMS